MRTAILIGVMSASTILIRALPFLVFRTRTPRYVSYLGKVLPPAIIGMLVVYCLKDISLLVKPFGIPELAGIVCTALVQVWKRNSLMSILAGTILYMLLIQSPIL